METATIYTKLHLTVQNVHTVELPPQIASRPEPFTASLCGEFSEHTQSVAPSHADDDLEKVETSSLFVVAN